MTAQPSLQPLLDKYFDYLKYERNLAAKSIENYQRPVSYTHLTLPTTPYV